MKILISGAGIAGPTAAFWLAHFGFKVTLLEKAPHLRTGGYIIDFWGTGFDVAERMGLLPTILQRGYAVQEVRVVNRHGERKTGFSLGAFAQSLKGRFTSIAHGDLVKAIFRALGTDVEMVFGDSIESLTQNDSGVHVHLQHGGDRTFDLLLGADGLHSWTRQLMFGEEPSFERYLGYQAAAFEVAGYGPRDELAYVMYTKVGQQIARFSLRDGRTMFLFTFAHQEPGLPDSVAAKKAFLRRLFENGGWECSRILDALDTVDDLYFDQVSQVRLASSTGSWSQGRITLLGDAASCVSLLAGEGSGLAMAAAYILAGELHQSGGEYAKAFARYQALFGPFVLGKQRATLRQAALFAPRSKSSMFLRNQVFRLMNVSWVARLVAEHEFVDHLRLPEYK